LTTRNGLDSHRRPSYHLGMPDPGSPLSQNLQFQNAETAPFSGPGCAVCKQPIASTYYESGSHVVCEGCAGRLRESQLQPPETALANAFIYGAGAALAGCALYVFVDMVVKIRIGIVAIAVGWMVGTAIRTASKGHGGLPQQIMAVLLTYFAISGSAIPEYLYYISQHSGGIQASYSTFLVRMAILLFASPLLPIIRNGSGIISFIILIIGLRQAWSMTGARRILLSGPRQIGS
jgi:hypothetical protein